MNGGQDPRKVGGAKFFGMTFADGLAAPYRRPLGGNQRPGGKRCQRRKPPEAGLKARVDRVCNLVILGHHGRRPAVTVRFSPPTLRGNAPPVTPGGLFTNSRVGDGPLCLNDLTSPMVAAKSESCHSTKSLRDSPLRRALNWERGNQFREE